MSRYVITIIFSLTCLSNLCVAGPQPSFDIKKLNIKVGMKRSVLEKNIAIYTELKSDYSKQYPTESPTYADYVIKSINLSVIYKKGSPAPYVTNKDSSISHLHAVEQTVINWNINE